MALSCTDPVALREPTPLEQAEFRWAAQSLHSYTFEARTSCFCGGPTTRWCLVEVDRDTITRVTEVESGDTVHSSELRYFDTVDERFELIHSFMEADWVDELLVEYDSIYGYPTEIQLVSKPVVTDLDAVYYARNLRRVR